MGFFRTSLSFSCLAVPLVSGLTYTVPKTPPSNASSQLITTPIGVSLEFFAFPEYMTLPSTLQCLKNFEELTGKWPVVRIGGTTQDRATYNASSPNAVTYSVASPDDAPETLTFGPSFLQLAGEYNGSVIVGLNRQLNNLTNTIEAAEVAVADIKTLYAIELGNEPDFYASSSPINIYNNTWDAADDFASQVSWQKSVGEALDKTDIISAGVYFGVTTFSDQGLVPEEGDSAQYVKDFSSHNYPQSASTADLPQLMNHSAIWEEIASFKGEIEAANSIGKPHIMGETNSATGGGGGISPTFGAALWVMDYSLQILYLGSKALYFHQGTIGDCPYCWWGRYDMGAPYYGAYFATLALAGANQIVPLDTFTTTYAAWAIYKDGSPIRVLLYNSDYYASGNRTSQKFTLLGLSGNEVKSTLLTAPYATSEQDEGSNPSLGGQTFQNGTCLIQGTSQQTTTRVKHGSATFTVEASSALLIELC